MSNKLDRLPEDVLIDAVMEASGRGTDAAYELCRARNDLLKRTCTTVLSYSAARQQHLYPVVDLHRNGKLRSIYTGHEYNPIDIR